MSTLRKACLFLVLFGIGQTRACSKSKTYNPGDNVTVIIDAVQKDRDNESEIYFCGSTSKQHFTNVMLYKRMKGLSDNIDVNRNYTGRIIDMKMTNGSLSFLLLNVTFTDSGNFTDNRNSCEKAKSTILVTRRRLTAYVDETFILDVMCNNTNTSLVIIKTMGDNNSKTLAIYNMTQKNCTNVTENNLFRVQNCEFKESTLRLTFPSLTWHSKDTYIAWDDTCLLLDSIFIGIQGKSTSSVPLSYNVHYGNKESTSRSPLGYNVHYVNSEWFLLSLIVIVVVVLLVAAGTANTALRKLRHRRAIRYGNGSQNFDMPSRAQNATMISTTNSSFDNLTGPMTTNCAEKVKMKERQIYPREVQCVRSSNITTSKCRTPCNLPLSENAGSQDINEYEHVYEYALLHDKYRSDETYLSLASDSLSANPTPSNIGHDGKVQHSYMTLEQIAPDPTVIKKPNKLVLVADSSYWYNEVYTKSLPKVSSSNVYDKVRRGKDGETRCRGSNAELRNQEAINEYVPARPLALEDSVASDTNSIKQDLTITESTKDLISKSSPVCGRLYATL